MVKNPIVCGGCKPNTVRCIKSTVILFGGATRVLNLVSYCPGSQLREIAPIFLSASSFEPRRYS
jgi:hypothetical protein